MYTATGVFEMLAGGVLGAAANFVAAFGIVCSLSVRTGRGHLQLVVDD